MLFMFILSNFHHLFHFPLSNHCTQSQVERVLMNFVQHNHPCLLTYMYILSLHCTIQLIQITLYEIRTDHKTYHIKNTPTAIKRHHYKLTNTPLTINHHHHIGKTAEFNVIEKSLRHLFNDFRLLWSCDINSYVICFISGHQTTINYKQSMHMPPRTQTKSVSEWQTLLNAPYGPTNKWSGERVVVVSDSDADLAKK